MRFFQERTSLEIMASGSSSSGRNWSLLETILFTQDVDVPSENEFLPLIFLVVKKEETKSNSPPSPRVLIQRDQYIVFEHLPEDWTEQLGREIEEKMDRRLICVLDRHPVEKLFAFPEIQEQGITKRHYDAYLYVFQMKYEVFLGDIGCKESHIAVVGNVDAGKSTLVSCLGFGTCLEEHPEPREWVMIHPHEKKTGRTSFPGHCVLGFSIDGTPVYAVKDRRSKKPVIPNNQQPVHTFVTFSDLCGHSRYGSTTATGLSSSQNLCAMVVMSPKDILEKTSEHLESSLPSHIQFSVELGQPLFFVLTKTCFFSKAEVAGFIQSLKSHMLRLYEIRVQVIEDEKSVVSIAHEWENSRMDISPEIRAPRVPLFLVDSFDRRGYPLLEKFLFCLPSRLKNMRNVQESSPLFVVTETYQPKGVNLVLSGYMGEGFLHQNEELELGPFSDGSYVPFRVRSMQINRCNVTKVQKGQSVCLGTGTPIPRKSVKRGMVAVRKSDWPYPEELSVLRFVAWLRISKRRSITLKRGSCINFVFSNFRATMLIIRISKRGDKEEEEEEESRKFLCSGETAEVVLKFINKTPRFVRKDSVFIGKDDKFICSGVVKKIIS